MEHLREPSELPPATVAEGIGRVCEWCGATVGTDAAPRNLAADVGRRRRRYLPAGYWCCGDACRARVVRFVRLHVAAGPPLWALTILAFALGVVALAALLPPPLRLWTPSPGTLAGLLATIGIVGLVAGSLVAIVPCTFIARRPEGEPPVVPLRRATLMNRALGAAMAALSLILALRTMLEAA